MRPDDRIKSYVIIGEAGRGGMGIVYHARDESLDRDVAIKVLPEMVAFNPERMARFEREAKLLASLRHPNIALIYGLEQEERTAFLVLEYVEGDTLAERTGAGPMPWRDAVPIAIQVANAIEYAHRKGVIHRDLKPANIKFDEEGNAKVLDFGLAKVMNDESSEAPLSGSSAEMETIADPSGPSDGPGSTLPGVLIGTMGYASPEQARGKGVDKRTDIFSFGCVLFEMLAGGPPFPAETAADALGKTLHKEPEWDELPDGLPPRLRLLLERCLAKDLKHRLCDIGDARLELSELGKPERGAPMEPQVVSGGGFWKVAAVFLFFVALIASGLAFLTPPGEVAPEPASRPLVNRAITLEEDVKVWHFFSAPDGSRVYVVASRPLESDSESSTPQQEFHLYVRDQDDPELRSIHQFRGMASMDFSPDSESYYIRYADAAYRGQVDSEIDPVEMPRLPRLEAPAAGGLLFPAKRGAIWLDEETIILEGVSEEGQPELVFTDARTGVERKRLPLRMGSVPYRLDGLIGAFDDDHVLMYVSRYGDDGFSVNIATISLTTGELKVLVERSGDCKLVGNHLFFTRGDTLYVAEFDPVNRTLLDAGRPVQKDLYTDYSVHASFEITDDGALIYLPGGFQGSKRRLMFNDGSGPRHTGLPDGPYDNSLSVSGDGSRICTTRLREDGLWEIWAGTFDPPRLRRLFYANDIDHFGPLLSQDGEQVLAARIHNTAQGNVSFSFVVAPFDGSQPGKLVWDVEERGELLIRCFNHEGTHLLADMINPELNNGSRKLIEIDIETGEATDLLTRVGGATEAYWSPDGSMIAFMTFETGQPEIHVFNPVTGRTAPVSTRLVRMARWYVDEADGSMAVVYWDDDLSFWRTPVELAEDGSFVIGDEEAVPWVHNNTILGSATTDNHGVAYTIGPGLEDELSNHLVVIENWVDSIITPAADPSDS